MLAKERKPTDSFERAFLEAATEIGIPKELQSKFRKQLQADINDPNKAAKVAEAWLSKFELDWSDGTSYLRLCSKKATFKQICDLFVHYVSGKYYLYEQLQRVHSNKDFMPYLLLSPGPTPMPCPEHKDAFCLVLKVEHPYWQEHPLRRNVFCRCGLRQISKQEFQRLKQEGIQDPLAPPILNEQGYLTGHREIRFIPIKLQPPGYPDANEEQSDSGPPWLRRLIALFKRRR